MNSPFNLLPDTITIDPQPPFNHKPRLLLLLRGHIRHSFEDKRLHHFVRSLSQEYNLQIYIHTWNVQQSVVSWRKLSANNTPITVDTIHQYFKDDDLNQYILKIIIEDDQHIQLSGPVDGLICKSPCPLLAWKRYWYAKYRIISYMATCIDIAPRDIILNTRFDVFNNSNSFTEFHLMDFIRWKYQCSQQRKLNNHFFFRNREAFGLDNLYVGTMASMQQLINHFHFNLDAIIRKYPSITHQEWLVGLENNVMFDRS